MRYTYSLCRICGGSVVDFDIYSNDMLLLIFKSDDAIGGTGFNIEFAVSYIWNETMNKMWRKQQN